MMTRKTKGLFANLLLLVFSMLVCFLFLEIVTRLLIKDYVRVLHNVVPDKVISFVPNSLSHYHSEEFDFTVKANRYGRRDKEWTPEMIADEGNYIFIGDSFVLGYGVDDAYSQPTLLEKQLQQTDSDTEVFNFGLSWAFPEYYQLLQEAIDLKVAAKHVIVGIFVGNDFSQNPASVKMGQDQFMRQGELMTFKQSSFLQYLKKRLVGSPLFMGIAFKVADALGLEIYASSASYIFLREQSIEEQEKFNANLAQLLTIQELAEEHGKRVSFVLYPNKLQVENFEELSKGVYDAAQPNLRTMAFCKENKLRCLDLLPLLRQEYLTLGERLYYPVDRHFTVQGNLLASKYVFENIKKWEGA